LLSPDKFIDFAYSPIHLPNHGAGTGRIARLQLLDGDDAPSASPPSSPDIDHANCMGM
jgi:hypothetical protein